MSTLVISARRTPIGAFLGSLQHHSATDLGAAAMRGAVGDIDPASIDQVLMGCVLPAALGQAPARRAALGAGLPSAAGATTVSKVCGSGMQAIMFADNLIRLGSADVVIAGGMESMSNAPHLLRGVRRGQRLGDTDPLIDHMVHDGLHCAETDKSMGLLAEETAEYFRFGRLEQDDYALMSLELSLKAIEDGSFDAEIEPVPGRDGDPIGRDERPAAELIAKLPSLRPAFRSDGTITAASASGIADGAAAVLLASEQYAKTHGLDALGSVVGQASFAHEPERFTTAPIGAISALLKQLGWRRDDVDLFEINEAFACVPMAAIRELELDPGRVNVNGGACALGHPIGATGCRIVVTLLHALKQRSLKRGIASLCIGGGEATAVALEVT